MTEANLTLRLEREDHDDGSITYHLWDGAGFWIVGLNDDPASQGGKAREYANAIVRAVNNHDSLVGALKIARGWMIQTEPAVSMVDDAIAKATR